MPYRVWATDDVPSAADFNALFADPVSADIITEEARANAAYGDMATVGPSVTLTLVSGQKCLVIVSSMQSSNSSSFTSYHSFAVSGASTLTAIDANAAPVTHTTNLVYMTAGRTTLYTASATGSHTFTSKYRTSTGANGTFQYRRIIVWKF